MMKKKGVSVIAALAGAAITLVALIIFAGYGATYSEYFDIVVIISLLLGAVGMAVYVLKDGSVFEYFNLIAVLCVSYGLGLFFLNSYPVWADWYGNFDMYGSRGGVIPVVILMVLMLIAIFSGIVSCFTMKKEVE
ncbi:MAG: hypothetical protein LUH07_10025 [Lachnospiraceae bacterium]|nr:hypothetical protein [Lachnospiraceae bacterium]